MSSESYDLLKEIAKRFPMTLVDYPNIENWKKSEFTVENLSNKIDRSIFNKGIHKIFLGFCAGDQLALYIIQQMEEKSQSAFHLFILDSRYALGENLAKRILKRYKSGFFQGIKHSIKSLRKRFKNLTNSKNIRLEAQIAVRAQQFKFKSTNIHAHLLISLTNLYPEKELGWRSFLSKMSSEEVPFYHFDLFRTKKGKEQILKSLDRFINEIK